MAALRIVLIATAIALGAQASLAQSETAGTPPVSPPAVADRVLGRADAPVRIDLYASFTCMDCANWYLNVLPEVRTRFIDTGQARLVFHDVAVEPLRHSVAASMIGLCAAPDKFFDVAGSFMSNLARTYEDTERVSQWYDDAIAVSGRDRTEIEACAGQEATYEKLRAQNTSEQAQSLARLPGVVVNRRELANPTIDEIAAAVSFGMSDAEANAQNGDQPARQ